MSLSNPGQPGDRQKPVAVDIAVAHLDHRTHQGRVVEGQVPLHGGPVRVGEAPLALGEGDSVVQAEDGRAIPHAPLPPRVPKPRQEAVDGHELVSRILHPRLGLKGHLASLRDGRAVLDEARPLVRRRDRPHAIPATCSRAARSGTPRHRPSAVTARAISVTISSDRSRSATVGRRALRQELSRRSPLSGGIENGLTGPERKPRIPSPSIPGGRRPPAAASPSPSPRRKPCPREDGRLCARPIRSSRRPASPGRTSGARSARRCRSARRTGTR